MRPTRHKYQLEKFETVCRRVRAKFANRLYRGRYVHSPQHIPAAMTAGEGNTSSAPLLVDLHRLEACSVPGAHLFSERVGPRSQRRHLRPLTLSLTHLCAMVFASTDPSRRVHKEIIAVPSSQWQERVGITIPTAAVLTVS